MAWRRNGKVSAPRDVSVNKIEAVKKADLRKILRARLLAMTPGDRHEASLAICRVIVSHPEFLAAHTVMLFAPQIIEPDLDLLWDTRVVRDKRIVYPRVDGGSLKLGEVRDLSELVEGPWKLREPVAAPGHTVDPDSVDLAVVPGIAFSHRKERLGRGGGYYDRLLVKMPRAFKTGVCFDFQLFAELPVETHDIPVNEVITHGASRTQPYS